MTTLVTLAHTVNVLVTRHTPCTRLVSKAPSPHVIWGLFCPKRTANPLRADGRPIFRSEPEGSAS
jgi:hypothetical protein